MPAPETEGEPTTVPKAGVVLMIVIVISMALLAIYANVQKARRDQIEKVTVTPVSPTASASPPANP
ncbi:MAG TPA: hypothetical protein VM940_10965 [Chthoniobacterales bacterium]|jgi:hypothetical protein|nr:hypothetical protein [Chthoniobacterales bacterium]